MMQGRVNQRCEATLSIALTNNKTAQMVDAVIDTGFSGFLTLPSDIIDLSIILSQDQKSFYLRNLPE